MMTNETLDIIKIIIENWNNVHAISSEIWEKIKQLFKRGDKSIGFVRRKDDFINFLLLSQKTFIRKYAKYILPTEYRGYLLNSIRIRTLYEKGFKKEADEKRFEMSDVNPKALRIYNLYNSGILGVLFSHIDKMISENKNEEEITGRASKILDDLINNKSIIYVHQWKHIDELYVAVKYQVKNTGYCLIYGSGKEVINKIIDMFSKLIKDEDMSNFEIKHNRHKVGFINHYNLAIVKKTIIHEENDENNNL